MTRKTGIDYRKEHVELLTKTTALEAKVKARAEELCRQNPKAPIGMGAVGRELDKFDFNTYEYINVIVHIENWLASQHPHQQQKLFK